MPVKKRTVDRGFLNKSAALPYNLRIADFEIAMQDVYDFFYDVNTFMVGRGLERLEDMLRPANLSGLLSDMLTVSVAKHARSLVQNRHFNGHPDLIQKGVYPNDDVKSGDKGVEIKTTRKPGGAVDTHGARKQTLCVFVYEIDNDTQPAVDRASLRFREVYLGEVTEKDFRKNARGELGTRTATLHADGLERFRRNWIYLDK